MLLTETDGVEEAREHYGETDAADAARGGDDAHCEGAFALEVLTYHRQSGIRTETDCEAEEDSLIKMLSGRLSILKMGRVPARETVGRSVVVW